MDIKLEINITIFSINIKWRFLKKNKIYCTREVMQSFEVDKIVKKQSSYL